MSFKLVIEDNQGVVTRQIPVTAPQGILIERGDNKRLQIVSNTDFLIEQKIKFSSFLLCLLVIYPVEH